MFEKVRYRIALWRYTRSGRFGKGPDTPKTREFQKAAERHLQAIITNRLLREVLIYDIDATSLNLEEQYTNGVILPKGRALLRDLIHKEKERRFEAKTRWVTKFWLPLLAALVGIIGALTGLIAVSRKAPPQETKPPSHERLVPVEFLQHTK
jgi:hypothetical protein